MASGFENNEFPSISNLVLEPKSFNFTKTASPNTDELHPLVECDSCGSDVRGFRYKCLTCPNTDLCSECERQGKHAQHNMIRISSINKDSAETHHQLFLVRNQFLTRTFARVSSLKSSPAKIDTAINIAPKVKEGLNSEPVNSKTLGRTEALHEKCKYKSEIREKVQYNEIDWTQTLLSDDELNGSAVSDSKCISSTSSFSSVSSSSIASIDSINSSSTPPIKEEVKRSVSQRDHTWAYVQNNLQDYREEDGTLSQASSDSFEQVDIDEP